jgi:hypothetical protein
MIKTTKVTWTGDVREALDAVGAVYHSNIFNDKHKTCRRLKFHVRELTDEQLTKVQEVIQERRPDLNVTVSRWDSGCGWAGFGNTVVYYRPKVGYYMQH